MSTRVSYFITCDICGESAGHSHTESVARQEVRRHGWVRVRDVEGKLVDMCWRCAERAEMERDQQREDIRNLKAALAAANARAEAAEADAAMCDHYAKRALEAEAKLAAVPLDALLSLRAHLSDTGEYSIHRTDGGSMWIGESLIFGSLFEKIDAWLAQQSEVQP